MLQSVIGIPIYIYNPTFYVKIKKKKIENTHNISNVEIKSVTACPRDHSTNIQRNLGFLQETTKVFNPQSLPL